MDSERHSRISDLFLEACALDMAQRKIFLEEECAGDPALRAEVESLLAHDGKLKLETGLGAAQFAELILAERASGVCAACGTPFARGQLHCPACRSPTLHHVPAIPGYRFLRVLGEGGMGTVYLAEDTTLGRRVAVKMVAEALDGTETAALRFAREARIMAAVEHPNIARIYSFGQVEGRHYLIMEFIEGQSLSARIRERGRLETGEALDILRQVADALEASWSHGIVHRDIKPGNILLDANDRARVVDFGLAKGAGRSEDSSVSRAGQLVGTPAYLSPEQARGDQGLDFRSDIYSLGIVLFEMLAGKPPFRGASPISIVDQHLHTPLPALHSVREGVPCEIEQLCEWMTQKRPSDRPDGYAELSRAMEALQCGASDTHAGAGSLPPFLSQPTVGDDSDRGVTSFVGREVELMRLDRALERALAGEAGVVLVSGEAGSGKTALITEFARRAQERDGDLVVAQGKCNAQTGRGDPYLPFRAALGLLTGDVEAGTTAGTLSRMQARRLWGLLPLAAQSLVDHGPDLVGTLIAAQPLVARATAFTPSPAGWRVRLEELVRRCQTMPRGANLQQGYLFEQYTRVLRSLAQRRPLLLQLEDLHWADTGSCSLLFHLGRGIAGSRILLVATYRAGEVTAEPDGTRHSVEPVLNEFRRIFGDHELSLDEAGTPEFLDALVDAEPNRLGLPFRRALYRQTRGHPLFVLELLRSMREQGLLVRDDENCWIEGPAIEWVELPARVEGAVGERIGRLPRDLQEILRLASVQGEEFTAEALATVHGTQPRQMVRLLGRELDKKHQLIAALGIRHRNGRRLSDYRFRNTLFQKFLYGQMDEAELAYAHEEAGTALEVLHEPHTDEIAVGLAHHFRRAGVVDKAISYLRQAGDRAVRLSANDEGIAHFNEALALLAANPEVENSDREELTLQLALGAPLLGTAGPASPELGRASARGLELCDSVGTAGQHFQTLFMLVHLHANGGELGKALELAERLIRVAQDAAEPVPVHFAYWARGFALYFLGRFAEAREDHERVVELYDPIRDAEQAYVFGMDAAVSSLSFGGLASWCLGFPERAGEYVRRAIKLAHELRHPSSLAHALTQATGLSMFSRDPDAQRRHTEALLEVSREKGVVLFHAWGVFSDGWLLVEQGSVARGVERIRQGVAAYEAAGSRLGLPIVLGKFAQSLGRAGRVDEALNVLSDALSRAHASGEGLFVAELHRLKGELLLLGPEPEVDGAEQSFLDAVEIARRQQARSWELRATISLTRLWNRAGRRAEARDRLAEVFGRFSEGFDTPDLVAARRQLGRTSSPGL